MSVVMPSTITGTVIYEYAATSINFNRQVININGIITPIFTANISYAKIGYLTDSNKNKIGVISSNNTNNMMNSLDPNEVGNIYLDATKIGTMFSQLPENGKYIGEVIADLADSLIHADLISRGIIEG